MNEPSSPEDAPSANPETPGLKPAKINMGLATVAVVLIIVNLYPGFKIGSAQDKFAGDLLGLIVFASGRALVLPAIFIGVCSISKKYRNNAARTKIVMLGSVFVLISSIGGLAKLAA